MATFTWAESTSTQLGEEPRVRRVVFGDGYEERAPDGLNPIAQEWDLSFNDVAVEGGNAIVAFFRDHRAVTAFDWWPKWASGPIKVVCTQWSRTLTGVWDESDIRAHFKQVFEP
jgi:phage-related protein